MIGVPSPSNIILVHKPVQGLSYFFTKDNLIRPDVICHQDYNVIYISRDVIYVADQIQQFQHIDIHRLDTCSDIRCILAALDYTADRAFKEGMDGIIEPEERNQSILVLSLDLLGRFLESGKHGTLPA